MSGIDRIRTPRLAKPNARNKMSAAALFGTIESGKAALVIADPQYRGVLDKLAFGNEGARQSARADLPQMTDYDIGCLVKESARILRPSGHLCLWADKFTIGSGRHLRFLAHAPALAVVDLLAWKTMRFGMGRRFRCATEYLVIAQKPPIRAKGIWADHSIPDCWLESSDRTIHPHAKPHVLIEKLIRAVTRKGDLVIDPCAGGYGVLEACLVSGREFIGCDLI